MKSNRDKFPFRQFYTAIAKITEKINLEGNISSISNDRAVEEIKNNLYIIGGGFAVIKGESVLLLENQKIQNNLDPKILRNFIEIKYDYACKNINDLVDILFIGSRTSQKLKFEEKIGSPPEFIFNLIDKDKKENFKKYFLNKDNTESQGVLVVPPEEIIFFLLGWRFLLGIIATNHGLFNKIKIEHDLLNKVEKIKPIFEDLANYLENSTNDKRLPECEYSKIFQKNESKFYKEISDFILGFEQNNKLKEIIEEKTYDWISQLSVISIENEITRLGLISKEHKVTQLLLIFLNYCKVLILNRLDKTSDNKNYMFSEKIKYLKYILELTIENIDVQYENNYLYDLTLSQLNEKIKSKIKRAKSDFEKEMNLSKTNSNIIYETIFYTILFLLAPSDSEILKTNNELPSPIVLLRQLHSYSRFPIIPYYILSSTNIKEFDNDIYSVPMQHEVFSLWNLYGGDKNKIAIESSEALFNNNIPVVYALITTNVDDIIIKSRNQNFINNSKGKNYYYERLRPYIQLRRELLFSLARPLIDQIYYKAISEQDSIEKEKLRQQQKSSEVNYNKERAIAHLQKSIFSRISNKVVLIEKNFSTAKYDNIEESLLTLKLISKILEFTSSWRQFFTYDNLPTGVNDSIDFFKLFESILCFQFMSFLTEPSKDLGENYKEYINDVFDKIDSNIGKQASVNSKIIKKEMFLREDTTNAILDACKRKEVPLIIKNNLNINPKLKTGNSRKYIYSQLLNIWEMCYNSLKSNKPIYLGFYEEIENYILTQSNFDYGSHSKNDIDLNCFLLEIYLEKKQKPNQFGLKGIEQFFKTYNCDSKFYYKENSEDYLHKIIIPKKQDEKSIFVIG